MPSHDIKDTVTPWLLDSDPSIRWQVMRDLTGEPAEVVAAERSRVASEGWGAQLLGQQRPDGAWCGDIDTPHWKSNLYTLLLLIEPRWAHFTFPTIWHYDVLRGLTYLRSAGVKPDERVAEAVGLVTERRQADGRWLLDEPHRDAVGGDLDGGAGQPSRWITLFALRVLGWYSARD